MLNIEEIKARAEAAAVHEYDGITDLIYGRDIKALIAEVERLHSCKCVDKCKLVCMLDEYDKVIAERDTLKKALELVCEVVTCQTANSEQPGMSSNRLMKYFIQQAQKREGKK